MMHSALWQVPPAMLQHEEPMYQYPYYQPEQQQQQAIVPAVGVNQWPSVPGRVQYPTIAEQYPDQQAQQQQQQQQLNQLQMPTPLSMGNNVPSLNQLQSVAKMQRQNMGEPQANFASGNGNGVILPYFLEGAPKDIQEKFLSIIQNREESNAQKQQRLDQLIGTLDSRNQKMYEQFQNEKGSEEKLHRAKIREIVSKMSPEAQRTFAKMDTLLLNEQLSDYDKWQQMQDLYTNMEDTVRKEFNDKFAGH